MGESNYQAERELLLARLADAEERARRAEAGFERVNNILESISDGLITLDREWHLTYINRRAEQLLWHSREELLGKFVWDVFPPLPGPVTRADIERAAAALEPVQFESFFPLLNAWFSIRAYVSGDSISVYIQDITERKQAEIALQERAQAFTHFIDANIVGMSFAKTDGTVTYTNNAYLNLLGYTRDDVEAGRLNWRDLTPPEYLYLDEQAVAQGKTRGAFTPFEKEYLRKDGSRIPILLGGVLMDNDTWVSFIMDLTERKRADRNLTLLTEISAVLSSSLDYRSSLTTLTHLVVPKLADWCTVHIVQKDGSVQQLAAAHDDPAKMRWAEDYQRQHPPNPAIKRGAYQVIRTGNSELYPEITDAMIVATAQDEYEVEFQRALHVTSVMIVPLIARNRILGALQFLSAESGVTYTYDDLALAEELARRAAVAIDNAQLYSEVFDHRERLSELNGLLRDERKRLRNIVDSIPGVVWEATGRPDDPSQQISFVSDYAELMLGYSKEEWLNTPNFWQLIVYPEDRPSAVKAGVEKFNKAQKVDNQFRWITKDGRALWVEAQSVVVTDDNGTPVGMRGVTMDVTERRRTEQALRESEARLRRLVESNIIGVTFANKDRVITEANDEFLGMVGYTREDLNAGELTGPAITAPEYQALDSAGLIEADRYGACRPYEKEFIRKDGSRIPILVGYALLEGERREYICFYLDLSAQKQAEEKLREQTEALEIINRVGQVLSAELDQSRLVQAVTDAGTELVGARFGSFFYNVIDDERGPAYMLFSLSGVPRSHFEQFPMPRATDLFGPTFRGEGIIRIGDVKDDPRYGNNSPFFGIPPGHLPVISYLAVPVISRSGEVIGGLFFGHPQANMFTERHEFILAGLAAQAAVAMDNARLYAQVQSNAAMLQQKVAERTHELEEALDKAQGADRMKTALLATVSHEMRTPLSSIIGFSNLIISRDPTREKTVQYIGFINSEARRLADLINDFLDLQRLEAGREVFRFIDLDLSALIKDVVSKQETVEGTMHTFQLDLHPMPLVHADSDRIRQVVLNLLNNAIKYTPGGGEIRLTLQRTDTQALFSISDPGMGIPERELRQLFERFQRGDAAEQMRIRGTGLGLALCKEIISAHHGNIWAESEGIGKGSTFSFELPLSNPPQSLIRSQQSSAETQQETARAAIQKPEFDDKLL